MLEYKMKVVFSGDRWFQVEVVSVNGTYELEFKMNPNVLQVTLDERQKILGAVQNAINSIMAYNN